MAYIYSDEDNAPMNDNAMPGIQMNWKKYSDIIAQMQQEKEQPLPFTDPLLPEKGCWNCTEYDPSRGACTIRWNNADESYYNPDLDDREPTYSCDDWSLNPDADADDFC